MRSIRRPNGRLISFGGALFGHCEESAPREIPGLYTEDKLQASLVVNVTCGWACPDGSPGAWRDLISNCADALKRKTETVPHATLRDDASVCSDDKSVQSALSSRSGRSSRSSRIRRNASISPMLVRHVHLKGTRRTMTTLPSSGAQVVRRLPQRSQSYHPTRRPSSGQLSRKASSFKVRRPKHDRGGSLKNLVEDLQEHNDLRDTTWSDVRGPEPKNLSTRQLLEKSDSFRLFSYNGDDDDDNNSSIMDIVEDLKASDISTSSTTISTRSSSSTSRLERKASKRSSHGHGRTKNTNTESHGTASSPDYNWSNDDTNGRRALTPKAA